MFIADLCFGRYGERFWIGFCSASLHGQWSEHRFEQHGWKGRGEHGGVDVGQEESRRKLHFPETFDHDVEMEARLIATIANNAIYWPVKVRLPSASAEWTESRRHWLLLVHSKPS